MGQPSFIYFSWTFKWSSFRQLCQIWFYSWNKDNVCVIRREMTRGWVSFFVVVMWKMIWNTRYIPSFILEKCKQIFAQVYILFAYSYNLLCLWDARTVFMQLVQHIRFDSMYNVYCTVNIADSGFQRIKSIFDKINLQKRIYNEFL